MTITVREVAELTCRDIHHFEIHKGNFLDTFYRSSQGERQRMIEEEPEYDEGLPSRILPFLAGMVEKLCNDYQLKCPDWIFSKYYYLDNPNFWMDAKGDLRLILLMESPVEFKVRNVFTTLDTLMRV